MYQLSLSLSLGRPTLGGIDLWASCAPANPAPANLLLQNLLLQNLLLQILLLQNLLLQNPLLQNLLLQNVLLQSGELCLQVGIIRQVEVELDNTLRDLRDSHKEEAAKLKKWRALDKDVQAKLAEFPIEGGLLLLLQIFTAADAYKAVCQLASGKQKHPQSCVKQGVCVGCQSGSHQHCCCCTGDEVLVGTLEEEELLQLNVQQLEYR